MMRRTKIKTTAEKRSEIKRIERIRDKKETIVIDEK